MSIYVYLCLYYIAADAYIIHEGTSRLKYYFTVAACTQYIYWTIDYIRLQKTTSSYQQHIGVLCGSSSS